MPPFLRAELLRPDGLIARLVALRDQAGIQDKEIAARLGNDPSKISRIRRGQTPSKADVRVWAEACGADDATVAELLTMLDAAHERARVRSYSERRDQASDQQEYTNLHEQSHRIQEFQLAVIPGMLQTRAYAYRMFSEVAAIHNQLNEPEAINAATIARLARQPLLYDEGRDYEFLIDEPVLRRLLISTQAQRAQLDRLQTALDLPNVRFGIIPQDTELGGVPWLPVTVFHGEETIAAIESPSQEHFYSGAEADPFIRMMDRLWSTAVEGDAARQLILAARNALPLH